MKKVVIFPLAFLFLVGILFGGYSLLKLFSEKNILEQVISRFSSDSRIAEVIVTDVKGENSFNETFTTIKFVEYDAGQNALPPKYFTFPGNIIQFQSLVIRFDDFYVRTKDRLKGKSLYFLWKVFMLKGSDTVEYEIIKVNEVPAGYKIKNTNNYFERKLWERFWEYALNSSGQRKNGVKSAQIEAPGTRFIPGILYTLRIEHDGGIRIDTENIPLILKGERVL